MSKNVAGTQQRRFQELLPYPNQILSHPSPLASPPTLEAAAKHGFDFIEQDLPRDAVEPGNPSKHSPTAYWAAFTFSGVRPMPAKGK